MLWALLGCQISSKPNVVIIVVDTLRADHVGVYGARNPTTPNVDAYALNGVYFDHAFSHSGWTLPSIASLWTGQYPHAHRVIRNPTNESEFGSLSPDAWTLAEVFQRGGYSTAGVMNNTFLAPEFGLNQGFEQYFYQGADNSFYRSAKESTDKALQWWRETKGAKFLVVHYMDPHMNFNPPSLTRGRFLPKNKTDISVPFYNKDAHKITVSKTKDLKLIEQVLALYDEEILAVDVQVARLVSALGDEDTMYVFTSDHGEEFWDHGGFEHGHQLTGELTRIPLIFWGKGIPKVGKKKEVVSHVDVFSSILTYADLPIPPRTHGVNILGENIEDKFVLSESTLYGDQRVSIVNKEYRLDINQTSQVATLWKLNDSGLEVGTVKENQALYSEPLMKELYQLRKNIDIVTKVSGPILPTQESFQQLKELGYLEE